ncbi:FYVE, RhoGEF and PH domain-containing protein 4-like isoform X5 [Dermacentor silvarum]|uniref:FYVE, RhoGEF and PH domain-containing protein 4-like isoform X5 n=1 Tax=Dermacentor silvarum TaxID=543639 RepID=UPI002101B8E5|nr:FYVE, RhoGEF and PH domain-containing protein 4-like isoform X5 [Dermacentor silvarum]
MRGGAGGCGSPDGAASRRLSRWTLLLRQRSSQSGSLESETPPRRCSIVSGASGHALSGVCGTEAVQLVAYTRRSSLVLLSAMADSAGVQGIASASGAVDVPDGVDASEAIAAEGAATSERGGAPFEDFLEEARLRCASATEEQLADFVKKNRDSFARLLRIESCRLHGATTGMGGGGAPAAAASSSGGGPSSDRDSGVFTEPEGAAANGVTGGPTASSSEGDLREALGRTPEPDALSMGSADLRALLRTCPFWDRASGAFLSDAVSEPQLRPKPPRPFSEFPAPLQVTACSATSAFGGIPSRMSSSFHFTTTRTHFEYCGETNTFRFRNQEVSASLESSYESLSESEDEEESPDDDEHDRLAATTAARSPTVQSEPAGSAAGRVAEELLSTERTYVDVLRLLDQRLAFRLDQENRAHSMVPQTTVAAIFAPLKPLFRLHHDFLLPRLQERLDAWDREPRIGDVMKDFAPFLKMYAEYVKNFDQSVQLLASCYAKHPRFAAVVDEIHAMPECKSLTVQHHMLTPVQRVPRYQLLLKEYLKKLPDGSPDKDDTERALELVSKAADHANQAMKKIDQFKQLLEIQELVGGAVDLVSPTRELLRQGKVTKISARSGDHFERYLFVFTDMVLVCSVVGSGARLIGAGGYRVRAKLDLDGLLLQDGDNLETPNSFHLRNAGRSIELCAGSPEEKLAWMQTLAKAAHDLKQRKSSLKVYHQGQKSPEGAELGQRAPVLVRADTVSRCMRCSAGFSTFGLRWKHHCHACGICSGAVLSGYLRLKTGGRRAHWQRRWFALHRDFVLYSFRSEQDELPLTSVPVPGLAVAAAEKADGLEPRTSAAAFKLFHQRRAYVFQAQDAEDAQRWMAALERASKAEEPS